MNKLLFRMSGKCYSVNARETAPLKANEELFIAKPTDQIQGIAVIDY